MLANVFSQNKLGAELSIRVSNVIKGTRCSYK